MESETPRQGHTHCQGQPSERDSSEQRAFTAAAQGPSGTHMLGYGVEAAHHAACVE